jgi:hypothetical protein
MQNDDVTGPMVRLFPESSRCWPLWSRNIPGLDYSISPADIGLSVTLTDRIETWNRNWEKNFHWEFGWTEGFDAQRWADEGAAIAKLLQMELPDITVRAEYDWWLSED